VRRSDRLFQIIQILRGARRPVTAAALAQELERDRRTIYRDIADLMANGVPIRGEAGVGYVLEDGYDLPPLMLTNDEVEAAMLGVQWVMQRGDPALTRGARDLMAKLEAILPDNFRVELPQSGLLAADCAPMVEDSIDLQPVREAIRRQHKLELRYRDESGKETERTIWPIYLAYFERVRLIVGWCELRCAFRHFRTDRIAALELVEGRFTEPVARLRRRWRKEEFGSDHA
jgi:predicted DNA-binding transcriptional regulator YafY